MTWVPVTKDEIERVMLAEREGIASSYLALIDRYRVNPYPVVIHRFGNDEQAFVVARSPTHVVFFDDIEDIFGIATEDGGRLRECAMYGALALTIGELHRLNAQ